MAIGQVVTEVRRTRSRGQRATGRRRDDAKADRRAELVEASLRAIRADGPSASMDAMARQAGVTKPILYRHFRDKSGLHSAIAASAADALTAKLHHPRIDIAGPRGAFSALIDAYLSFVEDDPHVYRFLTEQRLEDPGGMEQLAGFLRRVGDDIARILGEGLRAVGADSGPAQLWANALVGLAEGTGRWWLENRSMPRARVVAYLESLAWDGMGAAFSRTKPADGVSGGSSQARPRTRSDTSALPGAELRTPESERKSP